MKGKNPPDGEILLKLHQHLCGQGRWQESAQQSFGGDFYLLSVDKPGSLQGTREG